MFILNLCLKKDLQTAWETTDTKKKYVQPQPSPLLFDPIRVVNGSSFKALLNAILEIAILVHRGSCSVFPVAAIGQYTQTTMVAKSNTMRNTKEIWWLSWPAYDLKTDGWSHDMPVAIHVTHQARQGHVSYRLLSKD